MVQCRGGLTLVGVLMQQDMVTGELHVMSHISDGQKTAATRGKEPSPSNTFISDL